MHVLVVGGNRFVGYLLVWRLLAAGHRVTVLNRGTLADPFGERVERLRGDRTTPEFLRLLAGRRFDATVDFAAFTGADVEGVLAALGERAGHYVLVSTGQVYLVRADCPRPAREVDYDGPLLPKPAGAEDLAEWDYGMGKRACEDLLLRAWQERRFPFTSVRIPMVNGERDHFRRIEGYLWRLLDGGPVLLPDGGDQPMRHVYGADVARAVAELLGRPVCFGQAYNLAQDETPTLREVVAALAAELGVRPRLAPVAAQRIRAAGLAVKEVSPFSSAWMSFLSPARAAAELQFRATPLRIGLGRIVASFLAHPPADRPAGYARRAEELALA
jgi:nucleoside-diphosphate-sugar epimerase